MTDVIEFVHVEAFVGEVRVGLVRMPRGALKMSVRSTRERRVMSGRVRGYYFNMFMCDGVSWNRRLVMGEADYWALRANTEDWFVDEGWAWRNVGKDRAIVKQPYGPVHRALDI